MNPTLTPSGYDPEESVRIPIIQYTILLYVQDAQSLETYRLDHRGLYNLREVLDDSDLRTYLYRTNPCKIFRLHALLTLTRCIPAEDVQKSIYSGYASLPSFGGTEFMVQALDPVVCRVRRIS